MFTPYRDGDWNNDYYVPLPLALIASPVYKGLTDGAKILYGILKLRFQLSLHNADKYSDGDGVFIVFKQDELATIIQKTTRTVRSLMAELEQADLIRTQKQGLGLPQKIYLGKVTEEKVSSPTGSTVPPTEETDFRRDWKQSSAPTIRNNIVEKDIRNNISRVGEKFVPPTVEEVNAYLMEKGYTFDPEEFVAFYESKGWMIGKNKMKNWKMACVTWQKSQDKKPSYPSPKKKSFRTLPDWSKVDTRKGWDA